MRFLYIIPARGGSKGIPHKNIKELNGKPLVAYSIDVAKALAADEDICVSTDDDQIIEVVRSYGLAVPFKRPEQLATDTAGTYEVLLHAVDFYEQHGRFYDGIVLLQPTSPLRTVRNVEEAIKLFSKDIDMVVSVKESPSAFVICEENGEGYLDFTLNRGETSRQKMRPYYEYNGAVYVINIDSLKAHHMQDFHKKVKYVMSELESVDIDTELDWKIIEAILS